MSNILKTDNWKSFLLSDLFYIEGSKTTPLLELEEYGEGEYPFVTTQATDNGVDGFFNYWTEEGGVLVIDSAVLGYCTYQRFNFSASDHVEKLIPRFKMGKNIALFLVAILNKEQYRYNYGRKASQERLKTCSIKLPSTKSGEPDWLFMGSFISTHSHTYEGAREAAEKYPTPKLDINKWHCYKLKDIFDIYTGKDFIYNASSGSEHPVIGHGVADNGVACRTEYLDDYQLFDNTRTISLADRGNFFATIQAENFYLGTRTKALVSKVSDISKEALLFVCTIINREAFRFNYGRVASIRTHDLMIKLPTIDGNPDWDFMSAYIKSLPYSATM